MHYKHKGAVSGSLLARCEEIRSGLDGVEGNIGVDSEEWAYHGQGCVLDYLLQFRRSRPVSLLHAIKLCI